jgi:hypothetical protein
VGAKQKTAFAAGIVAVAGIAAALYVFLGKAHLATGTVAGVGVAYLGFLLYVLLMPRPGTAGFSFVKNYLPGAVARYAVMIGAFCAVVFLLGINPLGVLLGAFLGMMASTFVTLNSMRQAANRPPEV